MSLDEDEKIAIEAGLIVFFGGMIIPFLALALGGI